jgi:hypothetical protein
MSPANSDASMLAVAVPAPLRPTSLAVDSCTRQHANLLVPGQIISGLVGVGGSKEAEAHSDRHTRGRMALVGEDGGVECLNGRW